MLAQTEDRGAFLGCVAADALEHRAAVAHNVREDVNGGLVPGNEAAIVPDFFGGRQHLKIIARNAAVNPLCKCYAEGGALVNDTQLYLAVGLPTIAVLVGVLINAMQFNAQFSTLNSRLGALES